MKVVVLLGGMSREREISFKTGNAVLGALATLGHEAVGIDPGPNVAADIVAAKPDVVFIALHGRYGEDGTIQGMLEILGIPYTGSGVLASAAAIDKVFTKRLFRDAALPTPDFVVISKKDAIAIAPFEPPYVVKPALEGSSLGMTFVHDPALLSVAIAEARRHDAHVLIEKFVSGTEVTVGILGNRDPYALPVIEIAPKSGQYDYASKYTVGATEYIIPPRLSDKVIAQCQALGLAAHQTLGCSGMSRVDMIVGSNGIEHTRVELLEVNTIPGMTETSLLPKAARAAGMEFPVLVDNIIKWALEG